MEKLYHFLFLLIRFFTFCRVIGDRELPGEGFSLLSRTADTEQKAWRKRQIAYKLSKRGTITQAVTDVILCSKIKIAPDGFKLAGEINGITICYKIGPVTHRPPPSIPTSVSNGKSIKDIENALHYVNLSATPNGKKSTKNCSTDNDYEIIQSSYKLSPPPRPPPLRATTTTKQFKPTGTLGQYTDIDGVPFVLNPKLNGHLGDAHDVSFADAKVLFVRK